MKSWRIAVGFAVLLGFWSLGMAKGVAADGTDPPEPPVLWCKIVHTC